MDILLKIFITKIILLFTLLSCSQVTIETEEQAKNQGFEIKVGKFPFRALGKSMATGEYEGLVKIIYDQKYGEMLGCHIIGSDATNMITQATIARNLETTYKEVLDTVHPHPTLSEAIMEATADAFDEAIHI